jgi:hypothetical protein
MASQMNNEINEHLQYTYDEHVADTTELVGTVSDAASDDNEGKSARAMKAKQSRRDNYFAREFASNEAACEKLNNLCTIEHFRKALITYETMSVEEVDALQGFALKYARAMRTCAIKRAFHLKKNAKNAKKAGQKATNAAKQKVRSQGISKDKKRKSALALLSSMDPAELAALMASIS